MLKTKKNLFVLVQGPTQVLDNTTLIPEAKYPINFTQSGEKFVLRLHYNRSKNFLFVNNLKLYKLKAKISDINGYVLCLGNNSNYFTIINLKK